MPNAAAALASIWSITWTLTLAAFATIGGLLIVRYARDHIALRHTRRYEQLQHMLLIHLESPLSEPAATLAQSPLDLKILAEVITNALDSIGGKGRQHIHDFVRLLRLDPLINNQLHYGTQSERLAAVQLLGSLPFSVQNQAILTELLKVEVDASVRLATVKSLSRLGSTTALPKVLGCLQPMHALSPPVVYDVLHRFGPGGYHALVDALQSNDTPDNLKIGIVRTLADIPSLSCRDVLIPYGYSAHPELCAAAFYALAQCGLSIDPILIAHGANHTYWKVRLYAARCGRHAQKIPVEALEKLMMDPNWMVSAEAAHALYGWGDAGCRILEMLAAQNTATSARAAKFLAEHQDGCHE